MANRIIERNETKEAFIEAFWKWYENYHRERYKKEGRPDLYPIREYHEKSMNFNSYVWDWVAQFVRECFVLRKEKIKELE